MGFLDKLKEMTSRHSDKSGHGGGRTAEPTEERSTGTYGGDQTAATPESVEDTLRRRGREDEPPA